jgi:hypothetical protein
MEHEQANEQANAGVARRSAAIYLSISVGAAVLFFAAASLVGDYSAVVRTGGAAWVGLLTLIVTMPVVISRVKKRIRNASPA